ncbi:MAG: hypothetical protein EVA44_00425 [Flavobacteriales bacterium]|jgi:hypothetical protein|nr:MAG: hypothetical protein EVA44_00425 [Flavobacteriales bacterium]
MIYYISFTFFILPFIIISYYNIPSADDFVRINSPQGYFYNIVDWYKSVNGRYFNAIISLPEFWYNKWVYKLVPVLFGAVFYFSLNHLYKTLFHNNFLWKKRLFVLYALIFFISIFISISQGFFWFSSVSVYLFPISIFIFLFSEIIRIININNVDRKKIALLIIYIFICVGSNEMMLVIVNFILFLGFILYYNNKLLYRVFSILFLWSVLCSFAVIFSPGSIKRQLVFESGGDLLFSLKNAYVHTLDFFIYDVFYSKLIIALTILIIITKLKYLENSKSIKIKPLLFILPTILVPFIITFVRYYSQGELRLDNQAIFVQGRVYNFHILLSYLFWFINSYFVLDYLIKFKVIKNLLAKIYLIKPIIFMYILYSFIYNTNIRNVYDDLISGDVQEYYGELAWRNNYVSKNIDEDYLLVPELSAKPRTIYFDDITNDHNNWKNKYYSRAMGTQAKISISNKYLEDHINIENIIIPYINNFLINDLVVSAFLIKELNIIVYIFKSNYQFNKSKFFLHLIPENNIDLPLDRRKVNNLNLDFYFDDIDEFKHGGDSINYFIKKIPNKIKLKKIFTGQFNDNGRLWKKHLYY